MKLDHKINVSKFGGGEQLALTIPAIVRRYMKLNVHDTF